jgi:hypothetical protein
MAWGSGCDGGSGSEAFIGVYEVSSHRMNVSAGGVPISCGDAGDEVTGRAPFIAFVVPPFIEDSDALEMQECETVDGPCADMNNWFTPREPGLKWERAERTSGCGATCCLSAGRATAVIDGDALRVDLLQWTEYSDRPESECTWEAAAALRDTDACSSVEVWEATRIAR